MCLYKLGEVNDARSSSDVVVVWVTNTNYKYIYKLQPPKPSYASLPLSNEKQTFIPNTISDWIGWKYVKIFNLPKAQSRKAGKKGQGAEHGELVNSDEWQSPYKIGQS